MDYLNGGIGYETLAKKYQMKHHSSVERWIHAYQSFGDDGLRCSRSKKEYSFKFKLHMVELYLSNEVSYQELALSQGMNNPSLITRWVLDFRAAGPDALRPKKKGRKKALSSMDCKETKPSSNQDEKDIDTNAEHVRELEDELLKLRIENAFLKELRRLRLEDEARMREQQESSVVSEDDSN